MKKIFNKILLIVFVIPYFVNAQPTDSLSYVSRVGYNTPQQIDIFGNYLYVTTNAFIVYDISNPQSISEIGNYISPDFNLSEVEIYNNDIAFGASGQGLRVLDISDKNQPKISSTAFYSAYRYFFMVLKYPYLFSFSENNSTDEEFLQVLNVSDTSNIILLDSINLQNDFSHSALEHKQFIADGNFLYLTMGQRNTLDTAELHIFDISNPSNIFQISSVYLGQSDHTGGMHNTSLLSLAKRNNYVYVAGMFSPKSDIKIVDVSNPSAPVLVNSWFDFITSAEIAISDSTIYLTNIRSEMFTIQITNDTVLTKCDSFHLPIPIYYTKDFEITISGNYAFFNNWDNYAVYIADISSPCNTSFVNLIEQGHDWRDVAVQGNYVYPAIWNFYQFYTIDASNPTSLQIVQRTEVMGWGWGIDVKGNYAYLAMGTETDTNFETGGLQVFDISNPLSPEKKGWSPPPAGNHEAQLWVDTTEKKAYILSGQSNANSEAWDNHISVNPGLRIVDVSNPDSLNELSFIPLQAQCRGIYKKGNYAYITASDSLYAALFIINLQTQLTEGFWQSPLVRPVRAVWVKDTIAYVAYASTLQLLSVANPALPYELTNFQFSSGTMDLMIKNNFLFVITTKGIYAFDVSNVASPVVLDSIVGISNSEYRHIDIIGEYIYVLTASGIEVFRYSELATGIEENHFAVFSQNDIVYAFPNPFRTTVNLQLSESNCKIKIFDTFGKMVYQQTLNSKHETLNLNLPNGIYLLQVKSNNFVQTKKLEVIK